jgi:hypothetical protein
MNTLTLAGLALAGLAVILGVAWLSDRYGQRRSEPLAPPPDRPRVDDATREIGAIRASWDSLQSSATLPPPPYRMETDTAERAVVVATRGKHRAAA